MARLAALLALVAALVGCASTRFENAPLAAGQANVERRAVDVSHAQRPLVLVAISGGGSRAAALGWVVLRELAGFRYVSDGKTRSLADDVAVVSSVSGGSVIAAYFALYGAQGLERFEPAFLAPDNMRTLGLDAANPVTWLGLAVTGSPRTDVVEKMFDDQLFGGQTFAALNRPGKPYLILNATDMASGEVFAFTPNRFDDICSDLDREPISVGVAASSAVPIVLSPIALRDFSAERCADRPTPQWIRTKLEGRYAPYLDLETYKLARYANDLRHGSGSFRDIDYLYLLDGGLADNLGIHGLLEAIASPYAAPIVAGAAGGDSILAAINAGSVRKIAVVVVNARADPAGDIYRSSSRPGILKMIGSVASVPIDANTAAVSSQMEVLLAQLNAAGSAARGNPKFAGLKVYPVKIDFDQLRAGDPAQRRLRDEVKGIPTLWTISPDNLRAIDHAGTLLLQQHPCFQRLLLDLGVQAGFIDQDFARSGCRQASD
jgi:NTE family protein